MGASKQTKSFLYTSMKVFRFNVEPCLFLTLTAFILRTICSLIYLRGIEIEQYSEIGDMTLRSQHRKTLHKLHSDTSRIALIGDASIEAAIGDNELPFCKGGKY